MTRKKTSAQLDREIAESLQSKRDRRGVKYVPLAWVDPQGGGGEASYAEDEVPGLLEKLRARGVTEVNVDYAFDFPLTSFSAEQLREVLTGARSRGVALSQYLRWLARK